MSCTSIPFSPTIPAGALNSEQLSRPPCPALSSVLSTALRDEAPTSISHPQVLTSAVECALSSGGVSFLMRRGAARRPRVGGCCRCQPARQTCRPRVHRCSRDAVSALAHTHRPSQRRWSTVDCRWQTRHICAVWRGSPCSTTLPVTATPVGASPRTTHYQTGRWGPRRASHQRPCAHSAPTTSASISALFKPL